MKKVILIISGIFIISLLAAQGNSGAKSNTDYKTALSIHYGAKLTHSSLRDSRSIGGIWGLTLDHQFSKSHFGFSSGIHFNLMNIGDGAGFTKPSRADNVKYLEVPFTIRYKPFLDGEFSEIVLFASYGNGLILDKNQNLSGLNYNIHLMHIGGEYIWRTSSSLRLVTGMDLSYVNIYDLQYGDLMSLVIYVKMGLQL